MVIKLCVRGFICVIIYLIGCEVVVKQQIDYICVCLLIQNGFKCVLVIGVFIGYGLVVCIIVVFGSGVVIFGIFFECLGSEIKLGIVGWYNLVVFYKYVDEVGLYVKSINGDVFFDEVKVKIIEMIKVDLGQVDQVVYSLVVLCCKYLKIGEIISFMLKLIGELIILCGLDIDKEVIIEIILQLVIVEEIVGIVVVMGGEDWQMWIDVLVDVGVLVNGCIIMVFIYVGEEIIQVIYWNGLIGVVKKDLDIKVLGLCEKLVKIGGDVCVLVLKVVVIQVSLVILIMLLYLLLLFKVMKEKGIYEGCIEQFDVLYDIFYGGKVDGMVVDCLCYDLVDGEGYIVVLVDEEGCLCVDYKEMVVDVQGKVVVLWLQVINENLYEISDLVGYKVDFLCLFGFGVEGVDYEVDVNLDVKIGNLVDMI